MEGYQRWVVLIVVAMTAVGAMGLVAAQLELSGAKERPCGTPLRVDLRAPTLLRRRAADLEAGIEGALPPDEARRRADEALAEAGALEQRCQSRQRLALLGLGAGGVVAASAVAWSTYQLGRRAGRLQDLRETRVVRR